ncbi:NAD-dependent epimerase/dehydratase family protein [Bacillus thuringiensis]|nr:NAD-dependent epimerase/dehydratase family protein [Bacillus thuringiensis]
MILITGATGNVGREVVKNLAKKNVEFQIATHPKKSNRCIFKL